METGFETEGSTVDSVMGQGFSAYVTRVKEWFRDHPKVRIVKWESGQEKDNSGNTRFSALIIFRPKQ